MIFFSDFRICGQKQDEHKVFTPQNVKVIFGSPRGDQQTFRNYYRILCSSALETVVIDTSTPFISSRQLSISASETDGFSVFKISMNSASSL